MNSLSTHDRAINTPAPIDNRDAKDFEAWLDTFPSPEPDWESMYPDYDAHDPCERMEIFGTERHDTNGEQP